MIEDNLRKRIHDDLVDLVDKTLEDEEIGARLKELMRHFGITSDALKTEVLSYTLDKGEKGYVNDRYQQTVARLTLLFHNLVKGTYHRKRHELVLSFLQKIDVTALLDVGYGVPGSYLLAYLQRKPEATAILADQDALAADFAKDVISIEDKKLLERIEFMTYDMNMSPYPGNAEVYIYLDSIEHTVHPTEYLKRLVEKAPRESYFIFSIPICSMDGLEGFHYAEWLKDEDARIWVQDAGLKVIDAGTAYPNPDVDYFAELVQGGYHNCLVLAQKA